MDSTQRNSNFGTPMNKQQAMQWFRGHYVNAINETYFSLYDIIREILQNNNTKYYSYQFTDFGNHNIYNYFNFSLEEYSVIINLSGRINSYAALFVGLSFADRELFKKNLYFYTFLTQNIVEWLKDCNQPTLPRGFIKATDKFYLNRFTLWSQDG